MFPNFAVFFLPHLLCFTAATTVAQWSTGPTTKAETTMAQTFQTTKQTSELLWLNPWPDAAPLSYHIAALDSFIQLHPDAKRVALSNMLVGHSYRLRQDASPTRSGIAKMLRAPNLNALELSMLRCYQLHGTYRSPLNNNMLQLQISISDILNLFSNIF
jgi:hypothetical protein